MPALTLPATRSTAQIVRHGAWRLELPHALPHDRLYWITRGQGKLLLRGRQIGLGAHNAILVPAGCLHALELGRQGFGTALDLPAPDGSALSLGSDGSTPSLGPDGSTLSLGNGRAALHLRIREGQAQAELTAILEAIAREDNARLPYADVAIAAHASLAVVWLHRHASDHPPPADSAATRLIARFCDRLVRTPGAADTMADLAASLDVTPTHLSRACKQVAGRTAAQLMTECALHRARLLIEDSDIALNRISATLGFGSAAYFSRFVQAHTGHAPSKLRALTRRKH